MRRLILNDRDRQEFIKQINSIELRDRTFIAEFKVFRRKRSIKANNLYFLWLNCIKAETGQDTDDLHKYFKDKFLPWRTLEIFGDEVRKVVSTTKLNTKEFSEYMEQIRMFALNELTIDLPQPGDRGWDDFYQRYGIE